MKKSIELGPNDHAALYVGQSIKTGEGIFSTVDFGRGKYLAPFDGIIYNAVFDIDLPKEQRGFPIQITGSQMQSATGIAKLVNHSCDPNCGLKFFNGWYWIYTRRPIVAGEQITWDYALSQWRNDVIFYPSGDCVCESARCRGINLGCESLPESFVREYKEQNLFTAYNLLQLRTMRGL